MYLLIIGVIIIVICILFGNKQENFSGNFSNSCPRNSYDSPQSPQKCNKCPVEKPYSISGKNTEENSCYACSSDCYIGNPKTDQDQGQSKCIKRCANCTLDKNNNNKSVCPATPTVFASR